MRTINCKLINTTFGYPNNYFLTLLYAGEKKSALLSFSSPEKEDISIKFKKISDVLDELGFSFHILPVEKRSEGYYSGIYVSKNERYLNKILNAKTHKKIGKCYGIPRTAVRAFQNEEKTLSLTAFILPEQFKNLEHFMQFAPSRKHLEKEMRTVKHWASVIKRKNPSLYDYMTG